MDVVILDVIDHEGKLHLVFYHKKKQIYFIFSRDRRQRSGSPVGRDRRRGGSRSRSPYSRSPVPRR